MNIWRESLQFQILRHFDTCLVHCHFTLFQQPCKQQSQSPVHKQTSVHSVHIYRNSVYIVTRISGENYFQISLNDVRSYLASKIFYTSFQNYSWIGYLQNRRQLEMKISKYLCFHICCFPNNPEGRGFDSCWYHWNSSLTQSFRSHYIPRVESASNRNEYQEYFLGGKDGRCLGLTTLPPSCADCL
jgi:hypothetical protein